MIGKFTHRFADCAPLLIRLALAPTMIYHGADHLFAIHGRGVSHLAQDVAALGFRPGMLWAILVVASEFVGGIFLFMGFMTRYAAAAIGVTMMVGLIWVHWRYGFDMRNSGIGWEVNYMLFMMSFTLFLTGGGKYSIDAKTKQDEKV